MVNVTLRKGDPLVIEAVFEHPDEQYLDWEETAVVFPAMGIIISEGVWFIRAVNDSWLWMICENVDSTVTEASDPNLWAQLNKLWSDAQGN